MESKLKTLKEIELPDGVTGCDCDADSKEILRKEASKWVKLWISQLENIRVSEIVGRDIVFEYKNKSEKSIRLDHLLAGKISAFQEFFNLKEEDLNGK